MISSKLIKSLDNLKYFLSTGEEKYWNICHNKLIQVLNENKGLSLGYLASFLSYFLETIIENDFSKIDNVVQEFSEFIKNINLKKEQKDFLLTSGLRTIRGNFIYFEEVMSYTKQILEVTSKKEEVHIYLSSLYKVIQNILENGKLLNDKLLKRLHVVNSYRQELSVKRTNRRVIQLEHDDQLRRAISLIFRHENIDKINLAKHLRVHIKDIEDILCILKDEVLICENDGQILISPLGRFYCMCYLGLRLKNLKNSSLLYSQLRWNKELLINNLEDIISKLEPPSPYYSQWYFDSNSVMRIIDTLDENMDLQGRSILCLMSPTVAVGIALTNLAHCVYALDSDRTILDSIKKLTNGKVKTVFYDVSTPIPTHLRNRFDCFIIDPPYNENYYILGLSRCIEALGNQYLDLNNKGKSGYVVLPPHEIGYVKSLGTPPLIINLLSKLEFMGFFVENMWTNYLSYKTPPFEAYVLKNRLKNISNIDNWRTSDFLKIRLFRNAASVFPTEYFLPNSFPDYRRFRRRYIIIPPQDDSTDVYETPEINVMDAQEWDEFLGPSKPISPFYLCFHDIGDWGDEANRLIQLKGCVAKYVWENLEPNFGKLEKSDFNRIVEDVEQLFDKSPDSNVIEENISSFLKHLVKINVLMEEDISDIVRSTV